MSTAETRDRNIYTKTYTKTHNSHSHSHAHSHTVACTFSFTLSSPYTGIPFTGIPFRWMLRRSSYGRIPGFCTFATRRYVIFMLFLHISVYIQSMFSVNVQVSRSHTDFFYY